MEQVKQSRIKVVHSACAMVAEEKIQFADCRWNVFLPAAVDNIQTLVGVSVVKAKPVDGSAGGAVQALNP